MTQFVMRRTLYAVVTLLILSLTIFTVVRLTGDPLTLMAEPGAQAAHFVANRRGNCPLDIVRLIRHFTCLMPKSSHSKASRILVYRCSVLFARTAAHAC